MSSKLFKWLLLAILCFSYIPVSQMAFDEKVDMNGDNISYYLLGNSMAIGNGYRNIHIPENTFHTHFPPGYPLIIASVVKVFGSSIKTVKMANVIFHLGSILLLFVIIDIITKNVFLAFSASLLVMINPCLIRYSTIMMSETPFLLLSMLAFYLIIKTDLTKTWYKNTQFLLSVLVVAFAFHVRSIGVSLLAGFVIYFVLQRKWIHAAASIGGFVLLSVPWYLIKGAHSSTDKYISQMIWKNPYRHEDGLMGFGDWFIRMYENASRYITREIPIGLSRFPDQNYRIPVTTEEWIIGSALIALLVFGFIKLRSYRGLIGGYLLGSFFVFMVWPPIWHGPRFLLATIPFLAFLICYAISELLNFLIQTAGIDPKGKSKFLISLIPLLFFFVIMPQTKKAELYANANYRSNALDYFHCAEYIAKNSKPDAVVSCRKTAMFYLFAKRKSMRFLHSPDIEKSLEDLRDQSVEYVVLDRLGYSGTGKYLVPVINKYPMKFSQLKTFGDPATILFRFNYDYGYAGSFDPNNKRSGFGVFRWPNGDCFEGEWFNGTRQGAGVLYSANGVSMIGTWVNDKLEGPVEVVTRRGDREIKTYRQNQPIE